MVHLGAGLDNRCRTIDISALFRGNTFGNRLVSQSAVRKCTANFAEVNMAGCRQHIDSPMAVTHIISACNKTAVKVEYITHDFVSVIVVIAVLRSLILNHIENVFIANKVSIKSLHQLVHCELLLVKNIILDSCKTVCDSADTNALQIVCVVSCAACIIVHTTADAVVCDDRKEWRRHIFCVKLSDNIGALHLDVDEVLHLFCKSIPELFIACKVCAVAQFQAELLAGFLVKTVVECQLKNLRDVEIALKNVSLGTECACFNTA